MHLKNFHYELPEKLIAQEPLTDRAKARLMVIDRRTKKIHHALFRDIGDFLPAKSLLVVNNSRVIPARLFGTKERSGGRVEIFLLRKLDDGCSFESLLRPMRKIKNGDKILIEGSHTWAEVIDRESRIVRFPLGALKELNRVGHIPLPPYIKRPDRPLDRRYYQTVYARHAGSVAAPTAGLHFTRALLADLKKSGHAFVPVTLHINYATFKPVEAEDITTHKMHEEEYAISRRAWGLSQKARADGRAVVAVGTTSCRVLEAVAASGNLKGKTSLFIYPGYRFNMVDVLLTNFHLPYSSLLMLVYAFGSPELIRRAYAEAIKRQYRFFSYGDAMVII